MPQFKFCFHLESKMSAIAPASSLPWSGPSPHCMRLRQKPLPPSSPFFVPKPQLFTWWYEFSFSPDKSPFFHMISFHYLSSLLMILFELEMVCIVWEVCVFAHLPSYWMLSDDCSRQKSHIFPSTVHNRILYIPATSFINKHRVTCFLNVWTHILAHM